MAMQYVPLFADDEFNAVFHDADIQLLRQTGWLSRFIQLLVKKEEEYTRQLGQVPPGLDPQEFVHTTMSLRTYRATVINMRETLQKRMAEVSSANNGE